jgi:DNA replication protein DnaC
VARTTGLIKTISIRRNIMQPINQVEEQLKVLKLTGIRESFSQRMKEASEADLGYEEFLNLCLFDEVQFRKNIKIKRLLKGAEFKSHSSCEGIDFSISRGLDKKLMSDLSTCRFIDDGNNIVILGPTGVGKSYVASAIGNSACRQGRSTMFCRMNVLIEKLTLSRAQGAYLSHLRKLSKVDLLILDDFGIKPLTPQQFQDVYDILDERFEEKSTVITSQLPVKNWSEVISDPVINEAITDRIISKAIKINMKGDSYRGKKFKKNDAN